MHLSKNYSIIPEAGTAAVNNRRSNNAYLVGSFFMIHISVSENIEGFRAIREAIDGNMVLGMHIKKARYNIRIVKLDVLLIALWSEDLPALCHGIGRTLARSYEQISQGYKFSYHVFMALLPSALL
jgi:hypothetical protein